MSAGEPRPACRRLIVALRATSPGAPRPAAITLRGLPAEPRGQQASAAPGGAEQQKPDGERDARTPGGPGRHVLGAGASPSLHRAAGVGEFGPPAAAAPPGRRDGQGHRLAPGPASVCGRAAHGRSAVIDRRRRPPARTRSGSRSDTGEARARSRGNGRTTRHAWAFLPLLSSGHPIGCLLLAYNAPHPFTAAERSILTPLAGLIAQALDRARLYDAQHNLAHALQQTLLPHALPTVTGLDVAARYLPASHGMDIGGDFYDLIRLTDTTAAAVIGDVQGHDMTAAALMGQVRMAVHSHATAGAAPDQVLARTDRDLADLNASRFVSCLYAHLDLARHQVTLASAGHPPPLVRHPDNRTHPVDIRPGPHSASVSEPPRTRSPPCPWPRKRSWPSTPTASWRTPAPTSRRPSPASPTTLARPVTSLCTNSWTASCATPAAPAGTPTTSPCSCCDPTAPLSHEPTGSSAPAPHIWSSGQT